MITKKQYDKAHDKEFTDADRMNPQSEREMYLSAIRNFEEESRHALFDAEETVLEEPSKNDLRKKTKYLNKLGSFLKALHGKYVLLTEGEELPEDCLEILYNVHEAHSLFYKKRCTSSIRRFSGLAKHALFDAEGTHPNAIHREDLKKKVDYLSRLMNSLEKIEGMYHQLTEGEELPEDCTDILDRVGISSSLFHRTLLDKLNTESL
jgi:hypothetical protein